MNTDSAEALQGTYVVTSDLPNRWLRLQSRDIKVPPRNHPLFLSYQRQFFQKVQDIIPGVTLRTIDMSELMQSVRRHVERLVNRDTRQVVISTCSDIAAAVEGYALSINRLFNIRGDFIGYGPRPGFDSLNGQIARLARKIAGRPVIIVEDGASTGGTLCFVAKKLEAAGIRVSTVVLGFCCVRAEKAIKETFDGELVIMEKIGNLVDWLTAHDVIPLMPDAGRVLGAPMPNVLMPVRTRDGASYAYPYVLPFGNLGEWTSLPLDGALAVSRFSLDASVELFECISERSKRRISIGDLVGLKVGVSVPISLGSSRFPALDTEVVGFLRRKRALLG